MKLFNLTAKFEKTPAAIDAPPPADAGVGLFVTNDNHALGMQLAEKVLALIREAVFAILGDGEHRRQEHE